MGDFPYSEIIGFIQSEHDKSLYWVGGFLAPSLIVFGIIGKIPQTRLANWLAVAILLFSWLGGFYALSLGSYLSQQETYLRRLQIAEELGGAIPLPKEVNSMAGGKVVEFRFDEARRAIAVAQATYEEDIAASFPALWISVASGVLAYLLCFILFVHTVFWPTGRNR